MFGSNSLSMPLHAIQSDLSQLENQLLRFKIVSTQSPLSHALAQNDLNFQLSSQLEAVKASFTSFCMKF